MYRTNVHDAVFNNKEMDFNKQHELSWNVYWENINNKEIVCYDIIGANYELIKKLLKTTSDINEFANSLRGELMYRYWSKCEHETVITTWVPRINMNSYNRLVKEVEEITERNGRVYSLPVCLETAEKIDVYSQIAMNWHPFITYIYSNKDRIVKSRKKRK